jgi:hypothetical protein
MSLDVTGFLMGDPSVATCFPTQWIQASASACPTPVGSLCVECIQAFVEGDIGLVVRSPRMARETETPHEDAEGDPDFLDEIMALRAAQDPAFLARVDQALDRRAHSVGVHRHCLLHAVFGRNWIQQVLRLRREAAIAAGRSGFSVYAVHRDYPGAPRPYALRETIVTLAGEEVTVPQGKIADTLEHIRLGVPPGYSGNRGTTRIRRRWLRCGSSI